MAINPLLESLRAAAATSQAAYDAYLSSVTAYNSAHLSLQKAVLNTAPGVGLSRAGTETPATMRALDALAMSQPFDFAADVDRAWSVYAKGDK